MINQHNSQKSYINSNMPEKSQFSTKSKIKSLNLSYFALKCKQIYISRSSSVIWFGSLLSYIDQCDKMQLVDDIQITQKNDLLRIFAQIIAAAINFYKKDKPNSLYKTMSIGQSILQTCIQNYTFQHIITKVNYLNVLAMSDLCHHNYSHAIDIFQQIVNIYEKKQIDTTNQIFLIAFSNYLSLLKKSCSKINIQNMEKKLKKLFFDILLRETQNINNFIYKNKQLSLNKNMVLVSVFKQNRQLLRHYEQQLNTYMKKILTQTSIIKKILPQNVIDTIANEKIKNNLKSNKTQIQIKKDELNYYFSSKVIIKRRKQNSSNRLENSNSQLSQQLQKIRRINEDQMSLLNGHRLVLARYQNLNKSYQLSQSLQINKNRYYSSKHSITNSIDYNSQFSVPQPKNLSTIYSPTEIQSPTKKFSTLEPLQLQSPGKKFNTLSPIQRSVSKNKQFSIKSKQIQIKITQDKPKQKILPKIQFPSAFIDIKFKFKNIFFTFNDEGLLIEHYSFSYKKFFYYFQLIDVIKTLNKKIIFKNIINRQDNHLVYDLLKILTNYITFQNNILQINKEPIPIGVVNKQLSIYKQYDGPYAKLVVTSQDNPSKIIGIMDMCSQQFNNFFTTVDNNDYIYYLSACIINGIYPSNINHTFIQPYLYLYRNTTQLQLQSQMKFQYIMAALSKKNVLYRCIYMMKHRVILLVTIQDNTHEPIQNFKLKFHITNIQSIIFDQFQNNKVYQFVPNSINRIIQVDLKNIIQYFSMNNLSIKQYIKLHQRIFVDFLYDYLHNIELKSKSGSQPIKLSLSEAKFQIYNYGNIIEFVDQDPPIKNVKKQRQQQKKCYKNVASATLIGSRHRIWALVIKLYNVKILEQYTYTLINPHYQFLNQLVNMSNRQKKEIKKYEEYVKNIIKNLLIGKKVGLTFTQIDLFYKKNYRIDLMDYLKQFNIL